MSAAIAGEEMASTAHMAASSYLVGPYSEPG